MAGPATPAGVPAARLAAWLDELIRAAPRFGAAPMRWRLGSAPTGGEFQWTPFWPPTRRAAGPWAPTPDLLRLRLTQESRAAGRCLTDATVVVAAVLGLAELFVPLPDGRTVLRSGPFLGAPLDWRGLEERFELRFGRRPTPTGRDSAAFARWLLGLPRVTDEQSGYLHEYARALAAAAAADRAATWEALLRVVRRAPASCRDDGPLISRLTDTDAMVSDMDRGKLPNAVVLAEPVALEHPPGDVRRTLFQHRILRVARDFATSWPDALVTLEGATVVALLTVAAPGRAWARARLLERVDELRAHVGQMLGAELRVGTVTPARRGEALGARFAAAWGALARTSTEGPVVLAEGTGLSPRGDWVSVRDAEVAVIEAVAAADESGASAAARRLSLALLLAPAEERAPRMHQVLVRALGDVVRRHGLPPETANALATELRFALRSEGEALTASLVTAATRLVRLADVARRGLAEVQLDALLREIERAPRGAPALADAARRAGLPVPTFRRRFRLLAQAPYARFVRRCRVRAAAQLVRDTDLTLAEVAAAVGFSGAPVLVAAFRDELGLTPGAFRRRLPVVASGAAAARLERSEARDDGPFGLSDPERFA